MTILAYIFIGYLISVFITTIIQVFLKDYDRHADFFEILFLLFITIPYSYLLNLFFIPATGLYYRQKTKEYPEPSIHLLSYFNKKTLDQELFALGFEKIEKGHTYDKIPYKGFYLYNRGARIYLIEDIDYFKNTYYRILIYSPNKETKVILNQIVSLERSYRWKYEQSKKTNEENESKNNSDKIIKVI